MKNKALTYLVALLSAAVMLSGSVSGAEYEFGINDTYELYPSDEMKALLDSLPEDVRVELSELYGSESDEERAEVLRGKLDVRYWLRYIAASLTELVFPAVRGCASLIGIVVISSLMKKLLTEGTCGEITSFTVSLVTAVTVGGVTLGAVETAGAFVSRICAMMNAMLPVMSAVMISAGSLTQMGVSTTGLMLYLTVSENLMRTVLIPISTAMFSLATVSGVFKGFNISSFLSGVRRFIMTLVSFSLLMYSFVMGIQTSLAGGADSLAMKTVRFAVGSYVPIVGGAVSEALSTVATGLSLVRRVTGTVGIVIILLSVLPTVISLFLTRLNLLICKSVSETLECDSATGIISESEGVLSMMLAFSTMTALFFIFSVILFMNTGLSRVT